MAAYATTSMRPALPCRSRWTPGIDWNARAWKDSASTALVDDVGVISTKEEARNRGGLERARWSATPSEPNISTTTQDTMINHLCRFDGFESKSDICVGSNEQVSDGGGHQAPESANGCRPPPFAPPKSSAFLGSGTLLRGSLEIQNPVGMAHEYPAILAQVVHQCFLILLPPLGSGFIRPPTAYGIPARLYTPIVRSGGWCNNRPAKSRWLRL